MIHRFFLLGLSLALLAAAPLAGALRALSVEELRQKADVIVVGDVESYVREERTRRDRVSHHYELRVMVHAVEKGSPSGKKLIVNGWSLIRSRNPGPSGNHTLDYRTSLREVLQSVPNERIRARFYLKWCSCDGHTILEPNGFEILERSQKKK